MKAKEEVAQVYSAGSIFRRKDVKRVAPAYPLSYAEALELVERGLAIIITADPLRIELRDDEAVRTELLPLKHSSKAAISRREMEINATGSDNADPEAYISKGVVEGVRAKVRAYGESELCMTCYRGGRTHVICGHTRANPEYSFA